MVQDFARLGWKSFIGYPKLFHLIVYYLSHIFHLDYFYILTYWTPILIVLPSLAIFYLLKQLFNIRTAAIASLLFLFTSNYPLYGFVDGNYPNMLGYGFFGVLCISFIIKYLQSKKWINLIYSVFFYLLTGLTHHLSFIELTAILLIFIVVVLVLFFFSDQRKTLKIKHFIGGFIVFICIGTIIFFTYKLYGKMFLNFTNGLFDNNPALKDLYLNQAVEYYNYSKIMGPIIWYGGLLGFLYLVIAFFSEEERDIKKILPLIWVLLIYILSRMSSSAIPERFARELSIPLLLCFAYLIEYIYKNFDLNNISTTLSYGFIAYIIIINSSLFNPTLLDSLPNSFSNLVWFNEMDQDKIDFIVKNINSKDPVFINPYANPYMELKSKQRFTDFSLNNNNLKTIDDLKKNLHDNSSNQKEYDSMIQSLKKSYLGKTMLISAKPPGNTDGIVYPIYKYFDEYNQSMRDIAKGQKVLKQFSDGSIVVQIVENK
jgi:hypothetical protein